MRYKDTEKGYTLTELMLYILVSSLVVYSVFYLINRTGQGFVLSRRKSITQSNGRDAISVMARDIKNMGFRYFIDTTNSCVGLADSIAQDSGESFACYDDAGSPGYNDSLVFWKAVLTDAGDTIESRIRVTYTLEGDDITRYVYNLDSSALTDVLVVLENVEALQFQYTRDFSVWEDEPAEGDRADVKAVKIIFLVRSRNEINIESSRSFVLANADTLTVNDSFLRRRFEEVVPVYNNYIDN